MSLSLPEIRGLHYPLEEVIRWFFKNNLHQQPGKVLELGCGNGNNLIMFHQFGWEVVGIDFNPSHLADAHHNFNGMHAAPGRWKFHERDLSIGVADLIANDKFDCLLLSGILYYISRSVCHKVITEVRPRLRQGATVHLRMRTLGDYRYGRGKLTEKNGYIFDFDETGELGCINVFYHEYELVQMMVDGLGVLPESLKVLAIHYQNLQSGKIITNDDIVIEGQVGA